MGFKAFLCSGPDTESVLESTLQELLR